MSNSKSCTNSPVATDLERSIRVAAIPNAFTAAPGRTQVLKVSQSTPAVKSIADIPGSNDQQEHVELSPTYEDGLGMEVPE
jgi:hypothetical protein